MGLGVGIFLMTIGAILAFAVHASLSGLDVSVVGWILMVAGAIGVLLGTLVMSRESTDTVVTDRTPR